jgi:hypothetical protein
MNAYVLKDAVQDRLRRVAAQNHAARTKLAKMLYVASALRVRPRAIDRYIDYFGDRVLHQQ